MPIYIVYISIPVGNTGYCRFTVDTASESSCSVTMFDRDVVSQYHSFVTMLGGVGATRPNFCIR